jgi:hypothetical protein
MGRQFVFKPPSPDFDRELFVETLQKFLEGLHS